MPPPTSATHSFPAHGISHGTSHGISHGTPDPAAALLHMDALTLTAHGLPLVSDVSLTIRAGEMVGLVGESGCGKSITALSILRLLPDPPIHISAGRIIFAGQDLAQAKASAMRAIRGQTIGMIFQEPMTSLNPVLPIGEQIAEPLQIHRGLGKAAALRRAAELLELVGIAEPHHAVHRYPHQLSGGQRQRVVIASAIACEPALLIADEPTTALDVTIQAQILKLMRELQEKTGAGLLLITHDLGVVAEMADDVAVMYAGRIVEQGSAADIFENPQHPYTIGLMGSLPALSARRHRLAAIPGAVPPPAQWPAGCRFSTRCPFADAQCRADVPALTAIKSGHAVACFKAPLEAHAGAAA